MISLFLISYSLFAVKGGGQNQIAPVFSWVSIFGNKRRKISNRRLWMDVWAMQHEFSTAKSFIFSIYSYTYSFNWYDY